MLYTATNLASDTTEEDDGGLPSVIIVLIVIVIIICFILCVVAVLKKRYDIKEAEEARLRGNKQATEETTTNTNTDLESGAAPTTHKGNVPSDTGGLILNDAIAIEKPPRDDNGDLINPDAKEIALR